LFLVGGDRFGGVASYFLALIEGAADGKAVFARTSPRETQCRICKVPSEWTFEGKALGRRPA